MTSYAVSPDVGAGFHLLDFISLGVTHEVCSCLLLRDARWRPHIGMAATLVVNITQHREKAQEGLQCLVSIEYLHQMFPFKWRKFQQMSPQDAAWIPHGCCWTCLQRVFEYKVNRENYFLCTVRKSHILKKRRNTLVPVSFTNKMASIYVPSDCMWRLSV